MQQTKKKTIQIENNKNYILNEKRPYNFTMCDFYYMWPSIVRVLRAFFYYGIWLVFQFDIICRLYFIFSSQLLTSFLSHIFNANYAPTTTKTMTMNNGNSSGSGNRDGKKMKIFVSDS